MKRLVVALALGLLIISTDSLSALDCVTVTADKAGAFQGPLKTAAASSEIVLLGRVETAEIVYPTDADTPYFYIARIQVLELWKGTTPATIDLAQLPVVGGMDLLQHVGATYVFFVRPLSPAAPLRPKMAMFGYTAAECVSQQMRSEDVSRELGKGYPPEDK